MSANSKSDKLKKEKELGETLLELADYFGIKVDKTPSPQSRLMEAHREAIELGISYGEYIAKYR